MQQPFETLLWVFIGCFTFGKVMGTVMVTIWGFPDSSDGADYETLIWEDCAYACFRDDMLMCAQRPEVRYKALCYKYKYGYNGTISKKEEADDSRVVFRITTNITSTCPESHSDYFNQPYRIPNRLIDSYQIATTPEDKFKITYNRDKCNWFNNDVSPFSCETECLTRMVTRTTMNPIVAESSTAYIVKTIINDPMICFQNCYQMQECAVAYYMYNETLCNLVHYTDSLVLEGTPDNHTLSIKLVTDSSTCKFTNAELFNYTYQMKGFNYSFTVTSDREMMTKKVNTAK